MNQPTPSMTSTYESITDRQEPIGIVIHRGPRDVSPQDPEDHPMVWAYVWAPAPGDLDEAA